MADDAPGTVPAGFKLMYTTEGESFEKYVGPIYKPDEDRADEKAHYGFHVEQRHCNPYGVLHGGMLTTVADTLLGSVVYHATGGVPIATVSLNVEFIGSAKVGDWVEGRAELLRKGRRMVFTRGMFHVGDKLIANVSGCWAIL